MKKIMIVEDDRVLGKLLTEKLSENYQVVLSSDKAGALVRLANEGPPDLIILDVGLPDGNGFEIAEFIKISKPLLPIIFLTAQADANSRLRGYEIGADEFIPKPFHLKELLIKIQHIFELHQLKNELLLENCSIFFNELCLKRKDGSIEYPAANDLKVLQFLVKQSPNVVSRDEILNSIWGTDKSINHRTIDNTIVRLKKLLGTENEVFIRSVRSVGYQWLQKKDTI